MQLYQKLYLDLFNAVTDSVSLLQQKQYRQAEATLIRAQQDAEERYLQHEEQE